MKKKALPGTLHAVDYAHIRQHFTNETTYGSEGLQLHCRPESESNKF